MKKTLLSFLVVIGFTHAYAQTQPSPQPLPYQQTFDALPSASTTYPDGWQGWTLTGAPSAAFNTATPSADKALATGTASSTTNGTYNYNGKLGFLNSGSVDNSLVLAINTSGQVNISFQYDVMTLRNPYDGSANTRINEVILQYRIGSTGNFTNVSGTEYQNSTTTQTTSGVTTPLDPATKTLVLPVDCNNQPLVQLRWVNRQIGGAGSRPSFAVDNILAGSGGADTTPPAISILQPANGATDVAPTAQPAITFTENIQAGSGQLVLHNVTTGTQQVVPINISNKTLTLSVALHPLQTYFIALDSAAILDLSGNAFAGITDSTTWRFSTGSQQLVFDFNNCTSGTGTISGFTQYSLSGAQIWDCTTFGQNNTNGVQINGYNNGPVENEDWLISPAFDLSGFNYPLLGFASRTAFAGPTLQLLVSTNYSGTGNPHNATWTTINGRLPQLLSDVWKTSDSINLAAFKQPSVYVAFVYTASPAVGAARWTIDDIHIANSATAPLPTIDKSPASVDFDYVPSGQQSTQQPFTFQGNDFTVNLTLTASTGFRLAKDSSGAYSQSLSYTPAQADNLQTVWVKFLPTTANQAYTGSISFSGISTPAITLSGTSLRSLKVVNWNIEWFGSPAQDPANDSLQQANVTTVLKKLDADIFALAEVVDTARFRTVVSQLNGYSYILSDFGSYADSIADPDYISAQKLAFVYKTSIIKSIRSYGILRKGGSSNAYYNWSSGRFPFLMEAKAKLNGDSALINFIVIHAKANTGTAAEKITSWQRRKDGALELKDSLDVQYPSSNFMILGDFNDAFDKTITTEKAPDTTTSYIDFINDSLHYKPLTLPLSLAGQQSTASFNTVIDNVLASDELAISYVPGSARVRREVSNLVGSYSTTTTDHYPVQTSYNLHTLANPLPVNDFTAVEDSGNVKISWQTPYEINAANFVVERSRTLRNFEPIDTITAHGTTTLPSNYLTYDTRPWLGISYYRLKIIGKDGTVTYSSAQRVVVTVRDIWKKLLWCIFGHQLQIWLDMEKYGPAQLQLIDLQGHIRYQSQITVNKGRNFKTLDINNLPTGIYFLRVQSLEGSQVSKILVNH
jgi:hypothetical protein